MSPGAAGGPAADAEGRVAVVTGAGRGIGAGVVQRLAAAGLTVVATDVDGAPAELAEGAVSGRVVRRVMDVTDRAAVERTAAEVEERFGTVHVLVNNAGVFRQTPALRLDEAALRQILDVNLCGTLRCTAVFGAVMSRHGGGRILDIASMSGLGGAALACVYAASKGGMIAAARSAARELAPHGITVNVVAPGFCDTGMMDSQRAIVDRFMVPRIPLRRVATVDDVAEVVAFLATSQTSYLTGSVVTLDGGLTSG